MRRRRLAPEARQHPGGGWTTAVPLHPDDPTCTVRVYAGGWATPTAADKAARELRAAEKPLRAEAGGQLRLDFRPGQELAPCPPGAPAELKRETQEIRPE